MQDPSDTRTKVATGHRRLFELLRTGEMTANTLQPDPRTMSFAPAPQPSSQSELQEIQLKAAQSLYYGDR